MYLDPRGGHNRKSINVNFFKSWTPQMAYVLGLISADGAVEDVRASSRTCYFALSSKDKSLILQVRRVLKSSHIIYKRSQKFTKFKNGSYLCAKTSILRVGNKQMVQDLINLGLTPRKSLRLRLPEIPKKYFAFFVRGYFDGDGCAHVSIQKNRKTPEISVIFTSGCKRFLDNLSLNLHRYLNIPNNKSYFNSGAFRLRYRKQNSLKILAYTYKNLDYAPYLARKYAIYQNYLKLLN